MSVASLANKNIYIYAMDVSDGRVGDWDRTARLVEHNRCRLATMSTEESVFHDAQAMQPLKKAILPRATVATETHKAKIDGEWYDIISVQQPSKTGAFWRLNLRRREMGE